MTKHEAIEVLKRLKIEWKSIGDDRHRHKLIDCIIAVAEASELKTEAKQEKKHIDYNYTSMHI